MQCMKPRFRMFKRDGIYYSFDRTTGKRESLQTTDKFAAQRLIHPKNESHIQPALNLQLARTYLAASDPQMVKRTWTDVLVAIIETKTGETRTRWERAKNDQAFKALLDLTLFQTSASHFLRVLGEGTVATNVFLRRLHNFVLDLDWIPKAILPRKRWPAVRYAEKRGITLEEHRKIVARERNQESRAFYELCWHLGGAQSDMANLKTEDVDWENQIIAFSRKKTAAPVLVRFGKQVSEILKDLPGSGFLFPRLAKINEKHRAKEFKRRCVSVEVSGEPLHSSRYAWAERAKRAGMSERQAMEMLGHNSKAIHRAYATKAEMKVPSLEEFDANLVRPS